MRTGICSSGPFLALVSLLLGLPRAAAQEGPLILTVRPDETEELLANPGIGWETFHHTARNDRNLPSWIPSTIQYARYDWGELERAPGKLDEAFLDQVLRATHDAGQKLATRVMCCSPDVGHPYHPSWLKEVGGHELETDFGRARPLLVPDMDDPVVLERHLDFIKRLGARYDGHPDLDHVDLGSIGWWGEWHMSGSRTARMPSVASRMRVVDAYLKAFKKTPLVMLINGGERGDWPWMAEGGACLAYAAQHGAGWRADSFGDMGRGGHMLMKYPAWFKAGHVDEVWKTAPVAWETAGDMRGWVRRASSLRWIFNYGLACHASVINNKSAPLPPDENVRDEVERFLRRLGYRLVLKQLQHPAQIPAGGQLALSMRWQNVGSAPCYKPYRLAYRLTGDQGLQKTFVSDVTVHHWLPGSIDLFTPEFMQEPADLPPGEVVSVRDTITLLGDLAAGTYALAIGIVEGAEARPVLRLGIKGRGPDGWYPLSQIKVVRP